MNEEQLGFRCEKISAWHRELGFDFPATDIDFLLTEYNHGIAKAMIEYKHQNSKLLRLDHPSICALKDVCNKAALPFFLVRYHEDMSEFLVIALNHFALKFVSERKQLMSATRFRQLLETLRK